MRAKILFVDDDQAMCWLLPRILSKHKVISFPDSYSAMSWMKEGNIPDLIISDYSLPEMNGNSFIYELKRSGLYRNIPIVMLSGWTNNSDVKECLSIGAIDYIRKPFDPEHFIHYINNLITRIQKTDNPVHVLA